MHAIVHATSAIEVVHITTILKMNKHLSSQNFGATSELT
jgi:hypothetical protein